MERRRKAIRSVIVLFIAALLLFTFMSGTIQSLALPKVAVEKPEMGSLDLSVREEGYLEPAYTAPLMPAGNWTVEEVHVAKGDRVAEGDPLITFDTADTERLLLDAEARHKQMQLKLSQMTEQLKPLLRGEDEEAVRKQEREMESQRLEMDIQQREIEELERLIRDGRVLRAPFEGVVTSLSAEAGIKASPSQQICEMASEDRGYQLKIAVSGDPASALQLGGSVKVETDDGELRQLDGHISAIESSDGLAAGGSDSNTSAEDVRTVTIDVIADGLEPGMKATAYVWQESERPGMLIPADAVHDDDGGSYVFTVTVEEGPLGSSYFAMKTYVEVGDSNDNTVVVLDGLMHEDRIITDASEPFSDGDRVRLE